MMYPEPAEGEISDADMKAAMAGFDAYAESMAKAGVLVAVNVLQPSTASTTVSAKDGALKIQDGPFADTKEKIGGIFTINVPDLDAALAWAEKNPAAQWGTIEVRPSALVYRDGAWQPTS
jgi:hypothetical protein